MESIENTNKYNHYVSAITWGRGLSKMKLLIISHTEHYQNSEGEIVGWGPTIREINFLATKFDQIYHCAPLHEGTAPPSSITYTSSNIRFVKLKPSGGSGVVDKLSVFLRAPHNIRVVRDVLKQVDVFQLRVPTGMGVYMIPYLNLFVKNKGWFKYAGNWAQENPPLGYAIQRYLLKKQTERKVTINGKWPDQPDNCITFENPCLTNEELIVGKEIINKKDYTGKLNFCFVGRLESAKGVKRILEVFKDIGVNNRVGVIHFVGDGPEIDSFKDISKSIPVEVQFHGFLSRSNVAEVMKECHVFLLPSTASEGFPKVIAEAANYGCLSVVSNVSSIGQYVKDGENGFLVDVKGDMEKELKLKLLNLFERPDLKGMVEKSANMSKLFTFEHYSKRIFSDIILV